MSGRGLIMVYTGDGKGKTTAALGMALRNAGHGRRVLVLQFMKGPGNIYGETLAIRKYLPGVEIVQGGRETFVSRSHPDPEDVRLAQQTLDLAAQALASGHHQLVVLDEVNVAVDFGLISESQVLAALENRANGVDVILTGRNAPAALVKLADLVSEVVEIKHHYRAGVQARAGIEH
ncbi:MAG: cob(I)yrinic acid a,c-diamide adenosyltransferase [Bacillota bacterium]